MEKGSMVGLGVCVVGVFLSAVLHGINVAFLFMEFGSIIIVVARQHGRDDHLASRSRRPQNLGKYFGKAMKGGETHSTGETIGQIVHLTNRARAEGLLALEEEAQGSRTRSSARASSSRSTAPTPSS